MRHHEFLFLCDVMTLEVCHLHDEFMQILEDQDWSNIKMKSTAFWIVMLGSLRGVTSQKAGPHTVNAVRTSSPLLSWVSRNMAWMAWDLQGCQWWVLVLVDWTFGPWYQRVSLLMRKFSVVWCCRCYRNRSHGSQTVLEALAMYLLFIRRYHVLRSPKCFSIALVIATNICAKKMARKAEVECNSLSKMKGLIHGTSFYSLII
jgi:hypothetical protein